MMVVMEPRMLSNENEVEEGLSNHLEGGEGGEEDDGDWLENAADLHSFTKVKSQPTLTARPGWFSSTAGDPTYICKGAKSAIFRPSSKFTPFLQTILKPRNGVSRVLQHLVRKTDQKSIHTQIQSRLQNLSTNLQNKSNEIEVLAVDLQKETLINFLSLEFESEEQFNSSVKTLLSHLPKQRYLKSICDEIHHFKITKRVAVVVLYSYKDDYYKILL